VPSCCGFLLRDLEGLGNRAGLRLTILPITRSRRLSLGRNSVAFTLCLRTRLLCFGLPWYGLPLHTVLLAPFCFLLLPCLRIFDPFKFLHDAWHSHFKHNCWQPQEHGFFGMRGWLLRFLILAPTSSHVSLLVFIFIFTKARAKIVSGGRSQPPDTTLR